jgi:hypothetical protein
MPNKYKTNKLRGQFGSSQSQFRQTTQQGGNPASSAAKGVKLGKTPWYTIGTPVKIH